MLERLKNLDLIWQVLLVAGVIILALWEWRLVLALGAFGGMFVAMRWTRRQS